MKIRLLACLLLSLGIPMTHAQECPDLLKFSLKRLRSEETVDFCRAYAGKVILAVNTASQCGFTPQFKGLEALYQKYKDRGLAVLGFPSGDFHQEFDDAEQTAKVCQINYGVTFPMFAKTTVRGDDANAFFKQLAEASGTTPKWNFYKYLIDRQGRVVDSYASTTAPDDRDLQDRIESLLGK